MVGVLAQQRLEHLHRTLVLPEENAELRQQIEAARAHPGSLPAAGAALTLEPRTIQLSALTKTGGSLTCRIYNASADPADASIRLGEPLRDKSARVVGLLGDEQRTLDVKQGVISLPLKPWEIASIKLY